MSTSTEYELTPSQELSFLNRQWTLHKAIINIATSVTVSPPLDADLLADAVRRCVQRWDVFGLRFVKHEKRYRQHFGQRDCLYLERRDFESAGAQERHFARLAARRMPLVDSPQAGFVVFRTATGEVGLFSVISHLIMDSWSISMFYRDVLEVYWALASGGGLPAPPHDHEPLLAAELAYHHSARADADRDFWEHELGESEPLFNSIKGSAVLAKYRRFVRRPEARQCWVQHVRTKADHVVRVIDRTDVARFQEFLDRQHMASMQVLFALALRLYLAKVNGGADDVTLSVAVARRGTLAEKTSGGSRVAELTVRTIMPAELTFADALEMLAAKQATLFRHADYSSMETLFLPHRLYKEQGSIPGTNYNDVMMTFQPVPMELGHGLACTTDWVCNGAFSLLCYLTVMDDDGSGGLRCYWERQVHHLPVAVIDDCQRFMVEVMRTGTANPGLTLGELMRLG